MTVRADWWPLKTFTACLLQYLVTTMWLTAVVLISTRFDHAAQAEDPFEIQLYEYVVQEIPDLATQAGNSYPTTIPYAINNHNEIVGYSYGCFPDCNKPSGVFGDYHAFLWKDGFSSDLGILPQASNNTAIAFGLNDSSIIVGYSYDRSIAHAVSWINGQIYDIGRPYYTNCRAQAINESNQIAGYCMDSWSASRQAVVWRPDLSVAAVPKLEPSLSNPRQSLATINDAGEVVGTCDTIEHSPYNHVAYKYNVNSGEIVNLGALPGHCCSKALDISAGGVVVGLSKVDGMIPVDAGETQGFVYENGAMSQLAAPSGWWYADFTTVGISDGGIIFANIIGLKGEGPGRPSATVGGPFIYERGIPVSLNSKIDPDSGWWIYDVYDINDAGYIIANAVHSSNRNDNKAVLLSPLTKVIPTPTATPTSTREPTTTPTPTPSASRTPTAISSPTHVSTREPTHTIAPTRTPTPTSTPSRTPTVSVTFTPTDTPVQSATASPRPSATATRMATPTRTPRPASTEIPGTTTPTPNKIPQSGYVISGSVRQAGEVELKNDDRRSSSTEVTLHLIGLDDSNDSYTISVDDSTEFSAEIAAGRYEMRVTSENSSEALATKPKRVRFRTTGNQHRVFKVPSLELVVRFEVDGR